MGLGYNYLINRDKDLRIGANVSYIPHLKGERTTVPVTFSPSADTDSIKWGIYLQGQMFKLDRSGKFSYTFAFDSVDYNMKFPNSQLESIGREDRLEEKLQTISFSVNYIFF